MIKRTLETAWRRLAVWWTVKRWLSANNPTAIACGSMWLLNRWAFNRRKQYPETTDMIYAMKDALVKRLYDAGHCVKLGLTVQHFPCWGCNGTGKTHYWYDGDGWGDDACYDKDLHDCERCSGTGDYRTIYLYHFVFDISGRFYSWHCPNVKWLSPGDIQSEPNHVQGRLERDDNIMLGASRKYHLEAVRQYLCGGLPALGLRFALDQDWRQFRMRFFLPSRPNNHDQIPF